MNDINRRGFLGTLIASVAALFAGKRTEASANDLGKHVEQPAFQPGDIVECRSGCIGVVVNWSDHVSFLQNLRLYRVETPQGSVFASESLMTKISHVDRTDPGAWSMYGSKDGKHQAILCKPTQSVKAGQCVIWNEPVSPIIRGRMPQRIEPFIKEWADHILECASKVGYDPHFRVLGFATNDVTVPTGSLVSGQTARWEEHPRDWCWVVTNLPTGMNWWHHVTVPTDACKLLSDGIM